MTVEELSLSGYDDRKELLAQRFNRAGKSLFVIALPLHLIPTHMPIPDPTKPFEGNRTVNAKHAADFGEYWRENVKWATPPLLLDTTFPLAHDFEPRASVAGVEFGVVKLPHNSQHELQILDGQHRILGWTVVANRIAEEMKSAREKLLRAKQLEDPLAIRVAETSVAKLTQLQERLRKEYVTVEILEGVTLEDHKQYFHDIAVNAKGITKSLTAGFDQRQLVNRVAMQLVEGHDLLRGRVDTETDNVRGRNENFVSARNVTDIVKAITVGMGGAWNRRKEDAFKEEALRQMVEQFLDTLLECFPDLQRVVEGEIQPRELREESLLGSATILRVLAGAYHALAVDKRDEENPYVSHAGDAKARRLFTELAPRMAFPIDPGWYATGYFPEPSSKAPSSRAQDLKGLTAEVARWGETGEVLPVRPAAPSSADAWA